MKTRSHAKYSRLVIALTLMGMFRLTIMEHTMPAQAQLELGSAVKPLFEVFTAVPSEHRSAYFEVLTAFAQAHDLKIRIAPSQLHEGQYTTDMMSEYIGAMGSNIRNERIFRIAFLPAIRASTVDPLVYPPQETIDRLRNDLRDRISRVANLTLLPE